jgi:hypothetical protein
MMRYAVAFFDGDLIRYDWEAAIHLHRVAINDFAIKPRSNINCKLSVSVSVCFPLVSKAKGNRGVIYL